MNRTLITLLLFSLISGGTAFAQQKVETITVTKSERLDYQQEASHFITETYYGMLQEAVASTEAHSEFIALLMLEDEVKYMPEFVSDHSAQRRMTPTQYFGCLNRTFSDYNSDDLIFKVENLQLYDDFYRHGLRGCYVRAEYNLIIKYRDDILSKKRCRMYCLFPNSGTKKIIKVMQLEPVQNLISVNESESGVEESLDVLLKKAKRGDRDAQLAVGMKYFEGKEVPQNNQEAVKWFRKAAEQGDARSQTLLGSFYDEGIAVPQNRAEAVKWYRKAAELGFVVAQFELGVHYYKGQGVPKDYGEAVKWYSRAAEQGYAEAQYNLGLCYYIGKGVSRDYEEAVKWHRKAAEQGDVKAQNNLGYCYQEGAGVPQDFQEAVKWYRKAAEQGHAEAQSFLGHAYLVGRGVPSNKQEAAIWFRKAADQGNPSAQFDLGSCYMNGYGVPLNREEGAKWYRKAAESGAYYAEAALGQCYEDGVGVAQNFQQALYWYRKAAAQGDEKSKLLLAELNHRLSKTSINKNVTESDNTHEWIKVSFDTPLLFREGSALLQKPIEVNAQLQRLNTEVISKLQSHVRIVGHISQKEAEAGMHPLALQRAKNIESILKKHGNVRHCEVKEADKSDSFDSAEVLIYMYVSKEALKKAQ